MLTYKLILLKLISFYCLGSGCCLMCQRTECWTSGSSVLPCTSLITLLINARNFRHLSQIFCTRKSTGIWGLNSIKRKSIGINKFQTLFEKLLFCAQFCFKFWPLIFVKSQLEIGLQDRWFLQNFSSMRIVQVDLAVWQKMQFTLLKFVKYFDSTTSFFYNFDI